ncbi:MAG TPA: hypothetical protein PKJ15_02080 [Methanomassiliicoccales archaeon]|nr:hypothetical protein [Methanomassiliicoccales archaeon]
MSRSALVILVTGAVLLVTMSSMYIVFQSDAGLEMEKGEEFDGLDIWWVNWHRGLPAKVGDSAYLFLDDQNYIHDNITHNYSVVRLDLRNGNVENRSLTGLENLDNNTLLTMFLQGEGEVYLIGLQGISEENTLSHRTILYELDLQSMRLGEGWPIPGTENANMADLMIDDGKLFRMPGYTLEFGGNDTELVPFPNIVTWDLESHQMVDNLTVPEYLCDAVLLPFNDRFFVYWVGNEYLSDSFVYDAEEQEGEPLVPLGDYDNYRMYEKSAAVCGNAIVIPYLREYVNFQWKLSNSTFALDDSFEPVKGRMEVSDVGEAYWLFSCGDDDEVITLQYWITNDSDVMALNIAAYRTTLNEGGPPFPSWLMAVPVAVMLLGLLLFLRKE